MFLLFIWLLRADVIPVVEFYRYLSMVIVCDECQMSANRNCEPNLCMTKKKRSSHCFDALLLVLVLLRCCSRTAAFATQYCCQYSTVQIDIDIDVAELLPISFFFVVPLCNEPLIGSIFFCSFNEHSSARYAIYGNLHSNDPCDCWTNWTIYFPFSFRYFTQVVLAFFKIQNRIKSSWSVWHGKCKYWISLHKSKNKKKKRDNKQKQNQ